MIFFLVDVLLPMHVSICVYDLCMSACFQLISLIENNSVVIIRGATGSGKTTQLPQYILDHYNEKNASCNIVVTQPRKIGATSIARWVATQRKCTLGSLVGYQVCAKFRWNLVYLKCNTNKYRGKEECNTCTEVITVVTMYYHNIDSDLS